MAIKTKIARHFALKQIIVGYVCLLLGIWGLVDYLWTIPNKQIAYDRLKIVELARVGLETEQAANVLSPEAELAQIDVQAEMNAIFNKGLADLQESGKEIKSQQDLQDAIGQISESMKETPDGRWFLQLAVISRGLQSERHLPLSESEFPQAYAAYELTSNYVDSAGAIEKPHKYDRIMKGLVFLPCLPFFPYFLWIYYRTKRQVFELDDDGTLHSQAGDWPMDSIADIDMSKWMAKSIAHVVNTDGTRLKLDDFKHRDLHLIIGAIASRLYPQDWDDQAKQVKSSDDEPKSDIEVDAGIDADSTKDPATSQIA